MKRKILAGVLAVLAMGVLGSGVYWTVLNTAPPMPDSLEAAQAMLTSARFQRLPEERKLAYYDRINELRRDMDPADMGELWRRMREDPSLREATRDMMEQMVVDRARRLALADAAERDRLLDEAIDEMLAMQRQMAAAWASGQLRRGDRADRDELTEEQLAERREAAQQRREQGRQQMEDRVTSGNPQDQALVHEYMVAVRERARERGFGGGWGR
ncbi:MAG: hypothetical protein WD118_02940 [Phycisphaeraceae bacterium]